MADIDYWDYLLRNGVDSPRTVLWVAHTSELLEQAVESLKQVWADALKVPELRLDRRFGQNGRGADVDEEFLASPGNVSQLVLGTPQRLINDFARWNSGWPEEAQNCQIPLAWSLSMRRIVPRHPSVERASNPAHENKN